jgi:hypothetical protein
VVYHRRAHLPLSAIPLHRRLRVRMHQRPVARVRLPACYRSLVSFPRTRHLRIPIHTDDGADCAPAGTLPPPCPLPRPTAHTAVAIAAEATRLAEVAGLALAWCACMCSRPRSYASRSVRRGSLPTLRSASRSTPSSPMWSKMRTHPPGTRPSTCSCRPHLAYSCVSLVHELVFAVFLCVCTPVLVALGCGVVICCSLSLHHVNESNDTSAYIRVHSISHASTAHPLTLSRTLSHTHTQHTHTNAHSHIYLSISLYIYLSIHPPTHPHSHTHTHIVSHRHVKMLVCARVPLPIHSFLYTTLAAPPAYVCRTLTVPFTSSPTARCRVVVL